MQNKLDSDIRYITPRLTTVSKETRHYTGVTRQVTTIIEDTIHDKSLKIPIRALPHPLGIREVIRLEQVKGAKLSAISSLLMTLLVDVKQNNTVTATYEELATLSDISVRTIAKAIPILEEARFLTREGKTSYRLSPKLCWFGNQVQWALELRALRENETFSLEDYTNCITLSADDIKLLEQIPKDELQSSLLFKEKVNNEPTL